MKTKTKRPRIKTVKVLFTTNPNRMYTKRVRISV